MVPRRSHQVGPCLREQVTVTVIGGMVLLSALPPPPHPLEPDVLQAHAVLHNGYLAARDVANLERPDLHQVRYHQEHVLSELVPLLDAISASTSDAAMLSWCYTATASFVKVYASLIQREESTQHRFESRLGHRILC